MYYLWLQRVRCYCILTLAVVRIAPPYVCVVTWCFRKARNKQCSVLRRVLEGLGQHCDCLTNSYHLLLVTVLCIQELPLTSCSSSQFTSCLPSFSPVTGAQIRNHLPKTHCSHNCMTTHGVFFHLGCRLNVLRLKLCSRKAMYVTVVNEPLGSIVHATRLGPYGTCGEVG